MGSDAVSFRLEQTHFLFLIEHIKSKFIPIKKYKIQILSKDIHSLAFQQIFNKAQMRWTTLNALVRSCDTFRKQARFLQKLNLFTFMHTSLKILTYSKTSLKTTLMIEATLYTRLVKLIAFSNYFLDETDAERAPLAKPENDNVSEGEPIKSLDEPKGEPDKPSGKPEGEPEGEPTKSTDEPEAVVSSDLPQTVCLTYKLGPPRQQSHLFYKIP